MRTYLLDMGIAVARVLVAQAVGTPFGAYGAFCSASTEPSSHANGGVFCLISWTLGAYIAFYLLSEQFFNFSRKACFSSLSLVAKSCLTLATPWTVACQAPLSMEFSRQEYWSGLPFPSPGDLPNPGIELGSPALQANSLPTELWGKLFLYHFLNPYMVVLIFWLYKQVVVVIVWSLSHVWLFVTLWTACKASLSFTISWNFLKLMSIESVMPSNHLVSVIPFSCLQSFPASGSFPISQLFASGGQSIGASASVSDLPMNIQGWFPLGLTGFISLLSTGLSRVFSNTTVRKH